MKNGAVIQWAETQVPKWPPPPTTVKEFTNIILSHSYNFLQIIYLQRQSSSTSAVHEQKVHYHTSRISRKYTISGKLQWPKISREGCTNQTSTLALFPARMSEISNPRLKAWLNRSRDWKVERNGNHDKNAIGAKMSTPIPASYILANSLTESHKPRLLTIFFQVMASCLGTTNSN